MFYELVQERYRDLIGRGETSPSALIKALDEFMAGHPVVAKVEAAHYRARVRKYPGPQTIFL